MPKPKIPNQRKAALEHKKRIERYVALINQLYDRLTKEAAKIAERTGHDDTAPFRWSDYPETKAALQKLQSNYVREMGAIVMAGTSAEWKESDLVQDLVAEKVLKAYTGTSKAGDEYARYFETDPDALKAFQQRRVNGMKLSDRVWNLSEQYKTELEDAVSAAIEPGQSAMSLAVELKKYLNEPDLMFRRFRYKDESGQWQRKWKRKVTDSDGKTRFIDCDKGSYRNEWTGPGYYKSSARNAQRLARTEINMAYRTAEQKRWEKFDFVVGFEVKTTQNGKHVTDICDDLAGKYPKTFVFKGWHPQCMCYCIPILKTEDEFWLLDEDAKSVNEVEDVPKGFKDWVEANADRINAAEKRGTVPCFIADNRGVVKGILKGYKQRDNQANNAQDTGANATAKANKQKTNENESKERANLQSILKEKIEEIPQYQPIFIQGDNIISGALGIIRGSIKQSAGHNVNISILQILSDLEKWIPEVKYIGWKPVDEGKHPEAECFIYYELINDGNPYYLNVKAHKGFKAEILYCIYGKMDRKSLKTGMPPDSVMKLIKRKSR